MREATPDPLGHPESKVFQVPPARREPRYVSGILFNAPVNYSSPVNAV